jgi:hypothetical protein
MKEDIKRIWGIISVLTLLFLSLPAVSAHIDIIDMGHYYDGISSVGYVDYQNVANHTVGGAILVFVDGDIVAGKILNMGIRYVAGFRCSPIKTLEFALNETEGEHTIVVYILSMNNSVERTYDYYAEGVEEDVIEEREQEEKWLSCWGFGG